MEEIKALHDVNIEWGSITNLMNKISDIEDGLEGGWPELIDMVADAASEEGENKTDPVTLFFDLYQFLFRLYYRLKANPEKRAFNKIEPTQSEGEDCFLIKNYDYTMFKWLKGAGFGSLISNGYAIIPKSKLSDKQRRAFERRCAN